MQIKTVGVLGCGLMGSGIAQVCAAAGYKTIVREVDDITLNRGLGRIRNFLDDGVAKEKVSADARDKTIGNLSGTTTFSGLGECDLIVEAIIENLEGAQSGELQYAFSNNTPSADSRSRWGAFTTGWP